MTDIEENMSLVPGCKQQLHEHAVLSGNDILGSGISMKKVKEYQRVVTELAAAIENLKKDISRCKECNESIYMNEVASNGPKRFECPYCTLQFISSESFEVHVIRLHSEHIVTSTKKFEAERYKENTQETIVITFTCPHCPGSSDNLLDLCQHINREHSYHGKSNPCVESNIKVEEVNGQTDRSENENRCNEKHFSHIPEKLNCLTAQTSDASISSDATRDTCTKRKGLEINLYSILNRKKRKQTLNEGSNAVPSNSKSRYYPCERCPFCDFFLFHKKYIMSHVRCMHPEVKNFTMNEIVKYSVMLNGSEINREFFQCPGCDYTSHKRENISHLHLKKCLEIPKTEVKNVKVDCIWPDTLLNTHYPSLQLICPYCEKAVDGKKRLEIHLKEHFKQFDVELEMNVILPELKGCKEEGKLIELDCYMCSYCPFIHCERARVSRHMSGIHPKELESPLIKCVLLDTRLARKAYLLMRLKIKLIRNTCIINNKCDIHEELTVKEECVKIMLEEMEPNLTRDIVLCPVCLYSTDSKRTAATHFNMNHPDKLKEKQVSLLYMVTDSVLRVTEKNSRLLLSCNSCTATSPVLYTLLSHVLAKHNHLPFSEPYTLVNGPQHVISATKNGMLPGHAICDTQTNGEENLVGHKESSHPEMTELCGMVEHMVNVVCTAGAFRVEEIGCYDCAFCDLKGVDKRDLYNHLYSQHPPETFDTIVSVPLHTTMVYKCLCLDEVIACDRSVRRFHDKDTFINRLHSHISMCRLCHVWCSTASDLGTHRKNFHQLESWPQQPTDV